MNSKCFGKGSSNVVTCTCREIFMLLHKRPNWFQRFWNLFQCPTWTHGTVGWRCRKRLWHKGKHLTFNNKTF